jgi:hypothetical protein
MRKLVELLEQVQAGPVSFEFCLHKAFQYFHEVRGPFCSMLWSAYFMHMKLNINVFYARCSGIEF